MSTPLEIDAKFDSRHTVFFHPDLGIGGAERLIVDAAVSLQRYHDHRVTIFTSHCDPEHCFDEARDGTLDVRVRGHTIVPATLFRGRFKILCSILRQIHLICSITYSGELAQLRPSVFILDQLSAGIPWLRWYHDTVPILFYCHFPDLLLVQSRQRLYTQLWRIFFDAWESWSIRGADRVIANSQFTKGVIETVFPGIGHDRDGQGNIGVIYPCVPLSSLDSNAINNRGKLTHGAGMASRKRNIFLSINRFEKKKDIEIAIRAYARLSPHQRSISQLVIAGGYDSKVPENKLYHETLERLAGTLSLTHMTVGPGRSSGFESTKPSQGTPSSAVDLRTAQGFHDDSDILFLLSTSQLTKQSLLQSSRLLLYTPSNEHFGIVPLEAMAAGLPVLATNTGGPLETVIHGETGWLYPPNDIRKWTETMQSVLDDPGDLHDQGKRLSQSSRASRVKENDGEQSSKKNQNMDQMRQASRGRVLEIFSDRKMARSFHDEINKLVSQVSQESDSKFRKEVDVKPGQAQKPQRSRRPRTELGDIALALLVYVSSAIVIFSILHAYFSSTAQTWNERSFGLSIVSLAVFGVIGVTRRLMQNRSAFR